MTVVDPIQPIPIGTPATAVPAAVVGTPATATPAAGWLISLRFRLSPTASGEYRFSNVHLSESPSLTAWEEYLQELMIDRTLRELIEGLACADGHRRDPRCDCASAAALRTYLQQLARMLQSSPPRPSSAPTSAGLGQQAAWRPGCDSGPS